MRCIQPAQKRVQGHKAGSQLIFSSTQIEAFRQMAQATQQSSLAAKTGKLTGPMSGVLALFFGSSGTGKTLAAEAIARELRTRVSRVNLHQVVSKGPSRNK